MSLYGIVFVSFPDSTLCEEKGLGTLEHFLGLAHHHVTAHMPIQIYANNHVIGELAEPKIGANVPRPFPCLRGGIWERDYRPFPS